MGKIQPSTPRRFVDRVDAVTATHRLADRLGYIV
jgi:hypothetical protein